MLLLLCVGQNGGDCMDEFQLLPEFFLLMYDVIIKSGHCDIFAYMVIGLTVYAIICLFWSLVLDD